MDNKKQFKTVDLVVFSVLALISEFVSIQLLNVFDGAGMVFSFAILITLIAIYRWGYIGSIVYVVAGLGSLFVSTNYGVNILYYPIANIAIVGTVLVFKVLKKEDFKTKGLYLFIYSVVPILFLSISKGLILWIVDGNVFGFTDYFASQLLTILITFIVLNLVVRVEGLLEDMNTYIQE